jgi:hypothetical protein
MPFGPKPLGVAYFAGVKFVGYSIFGNHLRKRFAVKRPQAITFGAARTLLGFAVGIGFVALLKTVGVLRDEWMFYVLLLPVRFGEWLFAIWLFFRHRTDLQSAMVRKEALLGSVCSYALDIPAAVSAFLLPGGVWIC